MFKLQKTPMNKLVKVSHDRKIAGVCEGLGDYFNIDSTLVRIGFAIATIFWGTGIPIYIALALIMPNDYEV